MDQITLYLDINLIRKYVERWKLFETTQDYCRFMFADSVIMLINTIKGEVF